MHRLVDLLNGLEYEVYQGTINRDISAVCYNTKDMAANSLFVCIKGFHTDSHNIAPKAVYEGATVIVCERPVEVDERITVIIVSDTRKALSVISANYYDNPSKDMIMIGVTGTKGKTTTVYMIAEILSAAGIETGIIGSIEIRYGGVSYSNENTTPESYIIQRTLNNMRKNGVKAVVMEVSSQGLMLNRVYGIEFDYGVFTNISRDHIGKNEHKDMEEYINCKARLFKNCKLGIYNRDDEHCEDIIRHNNCGRIVSYGIDEVSEIDYRYVDGVPGVSFVYEEMNFLLKLPGIYSIYNALAAIKVCNEILLEDEKETRLCLMAEVLGSICVRGRSEIISLSNGAYAVIDYAHNALALNNLLTSMRLYAKGHLICLFGCGGNRSPERRYDMGEISAKYADYTIITSDNPRYENPYNIMTDIECGIHRVLTEADKSPYGLRNYDEGKYVMIEDRKDAIEIALSKLEENDMIVIAGKGHEDYQEIRGRRYRLMDREIVEGAEYENKHRRYN